MKFDDRILRRIQKWVLGILIVAALLTPLLIEADDIRAPLLTFMGGAGVVVSLFHPRISKLQSVGTLVGTVIATLGSWFWLSAAAEDPFQNLAIVFAVPTLVSVYGFIGLMVFLAVRSAGSLPEPYEAERAGVVKEVLDELKGIINEVRTRGFHFDHIMYELFNNTREMFEAPDRMTYAWSEHDDLVGNYVVQRLKRTAEIAITRHPHQCKYGDIANALASRANYFLPRHRLVMDIDALPKKCPECDEPKPSHKASCMAAICWRCKFPTPPTRKRSENESVITPQCLLYFHTRNLPCPLQGEQVTPYAPIVKRLSLPFSIPTMNKDRFRDGPQWPSNKRALRHCIEEIERCEEFRQ